MSTVLAVHGLAVEFQAIGDQLVHDVEARYRADDSCCWFTPVDDGAGPVGFLYISVPDQERSGEAFPYVCDFAEITASLLCRLLQMHRSLEARECEVSTLVDVSRAVRSMPELDGAVQHLLDTSIHLTGFRQAAFFLLDSRAQRLTARAVSGIAPKHVPHRSRELDQLPPDIEGLSAGPYVIRRRVRPDQHQWFPEDGRTALCLPVQSEGGPIGTLWAYDRRDRSPDDQEIHVVESIAAQLASVMDAHVARHERSEQDQLKDDLRVASFSDASNLSQEVLSRLPIDLSVYSESHSEVGGDLCEVIPIDEHRTVIAVGDATGHSVRAAMIMAAGRGCVRSLTTNPSIDVEQTGSIVAWINDSLQAMTPQHLFMSLVYGVYDARTRCFTFTNAGHPMPVRWRDGETADLESHGLLLGVVRGEEYEQSSIQLEPGDIMVIYSDGVTEARDTSRTMFRADGIASAITRENCHSARAVRDEILSRLMTHTNGHKADDTTLLVMRVAE